MVYKYKSIFNDEKSLFSKEALREVTVPFRHPFIFTKGVFNDIDDRYKGTLENVGMKASTLVIFYAGPAALLGGMGYIISQAI